MQTNGIMRLNLKMSKPELLVCPAANFCGYREAGHYAHPMTNQCFLQCDAFGRSFQKGCAPGTFWKTGGPEPAMYNRCS